MGRALFGVALGFGLCAAPLPADAEPSSLPLFLAEERCVLTAELAIVRAEDDAKLRLAKGACLEVTRPGRRFSEVRTARARGLVDNRALSAVCPLERARCVVKAPLHLSPLPSRPAQEQALRLQPGGQLEVLRRKERLAEVRVGDRLFAVSLKALDDACPALAVPAAAKEPDAGVIEPACSLSPSP